MKTKLTLFVTVLAAILFGMGCESTNGTNKPAVKEKPTVDPLKNGLVAYYPFNGDAKDASGNGNDGKLNGATAAKDRHGADGNAYSFDGKGNYIEVSDSASLRPDYITISGWIYPAMLQPGDVTIVGKINYANATGSQYGLHLRNLKPFAGIKRNSIGRDTGEGWHKVFSSSSIPLNQWSHVTETWDGKILKIYVNGKMNEQNIKAPSGTIDKVTGGNLQIGRWWRSGPEWWNGSIDDVRIYNRALSAAEVKALYDLEKPKGQ